MTQNAVFTPLQRWKYPFVYFENLYNATDAMRYALFLLYPSNRKLDSKEVMQG